MKKLSKESRCIVIILIFIAILFAIITPISIVFKMFGLLVGLAIGSVVTVISELLLFQSGKLATSNAVENGKGSIFVILFYTFRLILNGIALVVCALMQWKFKNPYFLWSIFTCVGLILPCALIIAIFYHDDEDSDKKVTTK